MFGSEILEVAIGLVFIFLVTSLTASTIRETIESLLKTRAIQLERGIRQLLEDPSGQGPAKEVFDHPLLFGLFPGVYEPLALKRFVLPWARPTRAEDGSGQPPLRQPLGSNLPAYIPSRNFALALMHVVAGADAQASVLDLDGLKATALCLPDGQVRKAMLASLSEAGQDLGRVRTSLEAWFDSNMDRVSSWYKRETQWILLILGLLLAIALNIDSIGAVSRLATSNKLRQDAISQAAKTVSDLQQSDPDLQAESEDDLKRQLQGLSNLIGWSSYDARALQFNTGACRSPPHVAATGRTSVQIEASNLASAEDSCRFTQPWWLGLIALVPGWLLTSLAVSLGAPFWFDLLNKFMIVRSTVKPTQKSPSEGSDDRAAATSPAEVLEAAAAPAALQAPAGPVATLGVLEQQTVTVRLAIDLDGLDPGSVKLQVDGVEILTPPDGFVETQLSVDQAHRLAAAATRSGAMVRWSTMIAPNINSESLPLTAELVAGPG